MATNDESGGTERKRSWTAKELYSDVRLARLELREPTVRSAGFLSAFATGVGSHMLRHGAIPPDQFAR
jgi:hypothetical protein